MGLYLPDWFQSQFSTNVQMVLQYKGSVLRPLVTPGTYTGSDAASPVNFIGTVEMDDVTDRFAPMPRKDITKERRWISPTDSDLPVQLDSFDKLRTAVEPESAETMAAVAAAGRRIDRHILRAFYATAKIGVKGAGTKNYDTNNTVTVSIGGTNSRISVEKLLAMREKMKRNFVQFDQEEVFVGITAYDETALMREMQIVSSDYSGKDAPVLVDGKLKKFLGFNFVPCELIESELAGTNVVKLPVWCKSGMNFGIWGEIKTSISKRNDLRGEPWQLYITLTAGATRLEEGKVYQIESYRS